MITVEYLAQLKMAAGVAREALEPDAQSQTLSTFLMRCAVNHGENFRALLFAADGRLRPSLVLVHNDEQVDRVEADYRPVANGDRITLISPMSGG